MPLVSFCTPLKTSGNLWLSDVFRGYRKRPVARNGLRCFQMCWWLNICPQTNPLDSYLAFVLSLETVFNTCHSLDPRCFLTISVNMIEVSNFSYKLFNLIILFMSWYCHSGKSYLEALISQF